MGRPLTGLLLKALGAVVLGFVLLAVVGTVVGIVAGFVAMLVTLVVTAAVLGLIGLAAIGLVSLLSDGDSSRESDATWLGGTAWTSSGGADRRSRSRSRSWRDRLLGTGDEPAADPPRDRDPADRIRERYLAGDIDEAEFERQMERLLDTADLEDRLDRSPGRRERERERLRDR